MNDSISKSMLWFSVLFVLSSVGSVFALSWLLDIKLVAAATFVQALYTVAAIAIGGVFAWVKLQIFRDFDPHLTINQSVSHRRIGTKYVHLAVTAELKNSSKVSIEIRQALYRIQQISPLSDEEVEALYYEYSLGQDNENYILWPTYSEINNTWSSGSFVVEPGEIETEVYEFIVPNELERVLVYSSFTDDEPLQYDIVDDQAVDDEEFADDNEFERVWEATTVHDIKPEGLEESVGKVGS